VDVDDQDFVKADQQNYQTMDMFDNANILHIKPPELKAADDPEYQTMNDLDKHDIFERGGEPVLAHRSHTCQ
jgi:hypothetical protein